VPPVAGVPAALVPAVPPPGAASSPQAAESAETAAPETVRTKKSLRLMEREDMSVCSFFGADWLKKRSMDAGKAPPELRREQYLHECRRPTTSAR